MLFGGGIVAIAALALWIYCIVDVISTDEAPMRNLPKPLWLIIVIILPTVGSVVWLVLGRPTTAGYFPGDTRPRERRKPLGPDDSPDFMTGLDDRAKRLGAWEEDLRRREEELRRKEDDDGS